MIPQGIAFRRLDVFSPAAFGHDRRCSSTKPDLPVKPRKRLAYQDIQHAGEAIEMAYVYTMDLHLAEAMIGSRF
jgi:hypothetical protein